MNIGILGGSFDPVHTAHLAIAAQALEQLALDEVWFVPAWIAPHKGANAAATGRTKDRVAMLRLALAGNRAFRCCTIELRRKGTSYTIDTLRQIRAERGPGTALYLLIGADNYAQFHTWRAAAEIPRLCRLVVYPRPGIVVKRTKPPAVVLKGPALDLSSTWLRAQVARGGSIRYVVPEAVRAYINAHGMYRDQSVPAPSARARRVQA